ncbi:hypothetical protein [Brevundimonas balnearis]|uniref:Uncharacterized protein n=1 Tax=Brevundimonas balnearis TaxID=1572858 RepID=A0ABV6R0N8_9CAUL
MPLPISDAEPCAEPPPRPATSLARGEPGEDRALRLLRDAGYLAAQGAAGRAGISTLLAEIERRHPGEIARMAATLELRRLGLRA